MDTASMGRREGRCGESNMQTHLPCVKQRASRNFLYVSGNSHWGSVTVQRGGMGREEGGTFEWDRKRVNLQLIHADVWQNPMQYCKAIIFQLKIIKFLKNLILKKNTAFYRQPGRCCHQNLTRSKMIYREAIAIVPARNNKTLNQNCNSRVWRTT